MMKFQTIMLTLLAILSPSLGWANISVHTGDYDNLTRLVIHSPNQLEWSSKIMSDTYQIQIGNIDGRKTKSVLKHKEGSRISHVQAKKDYISFLISCDCNVTTHQVNKLSITIDVTDKKLTAKQSQTSTLRNTPVYLQEDKLVITANTSPKRMFSLPSTTRKKHNSFAQIKEQQAQDKLIKTLEYSLSKNIAQAASQGVLKPLGTLKETSLPSHLQNLKTRPFSDNLPLGMSISNPHNHLTHREKVDSQSSKANKKCAYANAINIYNWGDERNFYIQISEQRRNVYKDIEKAQDKDLLKLAQVFIHFGFGREAFNTLSLLSKQTPNTILYKAISQVIDDDKVSAPLTPENLNCDDPSSLWSFLMLSTEDLDHFQEENGSRINTNAIQNAFKDLPFFLQKHLRVRLAQRFLILGDINTSEAILSRGTKNNTLTSEEANLHAQLSLSQGDTESAREKLMSSAQKNPHFTAKSLQLLLELNIKNKVQNSNELLELAHALIPSSQTQTVSKKLYKNIIQSHIFNNDFTLARDLILDATHSLSTDQALKLQDLFMSHATQKMNDFDFVKATYKLAHFHTSQHTENAIATRLIGLGFHKKASSILNTPASGDELENRQHLKAVLALERKQYEAASNFIKDDSSQRASNILSASTAIQRGIPYDLKTLLSPTPQALLKSNEATEAWRTQDWKNLRQSQDTILTKIANYRLQSAPALIQKETLLKDSNKHLSDSQELRDTIPAVIRYFQ